MTEQSVLEALQEYLNEAIVDAENATPKVPGFIRGLTVAEDKVIELLIKVEAALSRSEPACRHCPADKAEHDDVHRGRGHDYEPATEPLVDTDCACTVCICDMGHVNDGVCRDCRNSDHSGVLRKLAESDVPSHDVEFDHKAEPIRHAGEIVCARCGNALPGEDGGGS